MDWSKYPNFSPDEFRCQHCVTAQCGANDLVISEQLMDVMQSIRDEYGQSMRITSGYRCPLHPIEERKSLPGVHSTGMACDVGVSGKDAYDLLKLICADDRVKGIGVNQKGNARFLHIDVKEDSPRPNIWSY
mgnify:FL=1